ncbi:uncharacterized protein LOC132728612 [Ruditapes philippinarum]|uniref:uncharacterized protein LOC132728612 n=1 Tax=Ruditapes philippinarum TaxID=129788 RepID=UPI00295B4505|nr:uncharacterized protein LOC132728612 [Ruditapes philippinarum]
MSSKLAAIWMVLFNILNEIYTGHSLKVISTTCGEKYTLDGLRTMKVVNYGKDELSDNPCYVGFTKSSNNQYFCIYMYVDDIRLDCDTSVEYYKGSVNKIDPEVNMSCKNVSKDVWCTGQYVNTIFVGIRKSSLHTSDIIKLRVELKDVPAEGKDKDIRDTLRIVTTLSIIFTVLFVFICCCVFVICRLKRRKMVSRGAVIMQADQNQANNPTQPLTHQSMEHMHYNLELIQSSYPAQQGLEPDNPTVLSQQIDPGQNDNNAPILDPSAPPSYESLMSEKH